VNRAILYVTASTSYARDTVSDIIRTELGSLATASPQGFDPGALLEYICLWTIKKIGQPELLVRKVLGCAGRWLEAESAQLARKQPALFDKSDPTLS
jgi:hypothetical protein